MFRSIAVKYIFLFMLIFVLSFGVLLLSMSSVVDHYSVDFKSEVLENAASSATEYLEMLFFYEDDLSMEGLLETERRSLDITLRGIIESAKDGTVLLTDSDGVILYAAGTEEAQIPPDAKLDSDAWYDIRSAEDGTMVRFEALEGVWEGQRLIMACPLRDTSGSANLRGAVIVSAQTQHWTELTDLIRQTMLISGLWILIAALLAVYLLTERGVAPMREISQAAKNFAKGHFEVRVPVHGNDEIADLATAFNQMATSISTYDQTRNTFLSSVAHDLRTPMTAIAGFVDEILDGVIPPDQQEKYLRLVSDEVRRLSRMVNSLLDLTRIEAGRRKFVMKPFNICEMARQILISFEQKIDAKHLEVEFICGEEDLYVLADYDGIYQVLYNLCDNAVKFSKEYGVLRLSLTARTRDKRIVVTVYNEGAGIPEEDQPLIFERFYKSDKSRGQDKTGVGLGLYIAKTIIDAHGGQIWVNSAEGVDCEFGFAIEAAPAPGREPY